MKINLKAKNFEITPAIAEYVEKRITNLSKLLSSIEENGGEVMVDFEVGKISKHHKTGEVFSSSCNININGEKFHNISEKEDLFQSIDEVKERIFEEISRSKDRKKTLFKRGALSIKKMLKGFSKRDPLTSK